MNFTKVTKLLNSRLYNYDILYKKLKIRKDIMNKKEYIDYCVSCVPRRVENMLYRDLWLARMAEKDILAQLQDESIVRNAIPFLNNRLKEITREIKKIEFGLEKEYNKKD